LKSDGKSGKTDEHALIAEYRRLKPVYADLCLSMSNLLYSLLQNGGYKFHLTHRVKDVEELRTKIRRRRDRCYRVLGDVEDLAGVRVIFYLESDKESFIRELRRELSGEIRREDHCKEEGYRATHLTVSFGEKRYRLSEYRKFRDLKCEIQLTSILYHAWSEIEHDIFYKEDRDKPSGRGKKLSELRKRLSVLMNDHITRANDELEDIARQVRNIRERRRKTTA
jgi:ppGpp synthetase/RelA/SpoT-type nucleotidyltranferase